MTTRRTWAAGPLLLLAGLALGLVLAGPAVASEPGPAYPPGAGADDVVQAGAGEHASGQDGGAGEHASGQDGGADDDTEVDEPATEERPDVPGSDDDEADGEETAADGDEVASDAAPEADESRIGPILVVIGAAVLLGGAVVAIARRI